jgi:hypothetical protein
MVIFNRQLPPGVTNPNGFKAKYQGTLVTGPSGIGPWINRTFVYQPHTDLGPATGRKTVWPLRQV